MAKIRGKITLELNIKEQNIDNNNEISNINDTVSE